MASYGTFFLLLADKKEVLMLMDYHKNAFKVRPPKFLRSKLYHYHFTTSGDKDWWTRELKAEYSPAISLNDHSGVADFLKKIGILVPVKPGQKTTNLMLGKPLKFLRDQAKFIPHHYLVWSISWIVVPLFFM